MHTERTKNTNGNGHKKGSSHLTVEFNLMENTDLILTGQGKLEGMTFSSNEQAEEAVRAILENIGEDPDREGLPTRARLTTCEPG